jgi:hypothetical protein
VAAGRSPPPGKTAVLEDDEIEQLRAQHAMPFDATARAAAATSGASPEPSPAPNGLGHAFLQALAELDGPAAGG